MKMTLKNRIAQSLELLSDCDFQNCMDSNDKLVVYHAAVMFGSRLSKRYNYILMNRNALPNKWHSDPILSDCIINSAFKKAYAQVVKYLEQGYSITPGRLLKLQEILSCGQTKLKMRGGLTNNEILHRNLRNLNNLRMHYKEMTEAEIYDFSFDMVYNFIDDLPFSNSTLYLSFLIMYWIQRENNLIPLALACSKETFLTALGTQSVNTCTEEEMKKNFRLFMRKLLNSHLKIFIRNNSKETKNTSRDRILKLIKDNPKYTAKTMASCLELSVQAVRKQIAILKAEKRLRRNGPDHGGKWEVIEDQKSYDRCRVLNGVATKD